MQEPLAVHRHLGRISVPGSRLEATVYAIRKREEEEEVTKDFTPVEWKKMYEIADLEMKSLRAQLEKANKLTTDLLNKTIEGNDILCGLAALGIDLIQALKDTKDYPLYLTFTEPDGALLIEEANLDGDTVRMWEEEIEEDNNGNTLHRLQRVPTLEEIPRDY